MSTRRKDINDVAAYSHNGFAKFHFSSIVANSVFVYHGKFKYTRPRLSAKNPSDLHNGRLRRVF